VLPVSYPERGITNPAGILSPVLDFGAAKPGATIPGVPFVPVAGPGGVAGTGVQLTLGAGYAITGDFGVRATVVAAQFNSPASYLGPSIGATYRFLKGDFEMGAALDIGFSTISGEGGVVFSPALPMHLHIAKIARLDVTPTIPISTPGTTTVGLAIPVQFAIDIIEPLHVGAVTGYTMLFNPPAPLSAGDTVGIPLGFIAGYAIAGPKGPILDLDPFFLWPALFTPGVSGPGTSATNAGIFDVGIEATYYFYL
jgi:hypothetical protein